MKGSPGGFAGHPADSGLGNPLSTGSAFLEYAERMEGGCQETDTLPLFLYPYPFHWKLIPAMTALFTGRNPLEWPIVEHVRYLVDQRAHHTGHIQYHWPAGGSLRCLRRCWTEFGGLSGAQKGRWRLVHQTTGKHWSMEYTSMMDDEEVTKHQLNQWLKEQVEKNLRLAKGLPYWYKPKAGTYQLFACWELVRCWPTVVETNPDMAVEQVRPFALHINNRRNDLVEFLERVSSYANLLNGDQVAALHAVERNGMMYNVDAWQKGPITWADYNLL